MKKNLIDYKTRPQAFAKDNIATSKVMSFAFKCITKLGDILADNF